RFCSLLVYFCFSYVLNLYMGFVSRPLIRLLKHEIMPLLHPEVEHRIGTGIALVQGIVITCLTVIFQLLLYGKFGTFLWDRWLENVLNLYSLSSPITAIAYINFAMAHAIRSSGEQGNLAHYIQRLMQLGPVVSRTTYL